MRVVVLQHESIECRRAGCRRTRKTPCSAEAAADAVGAVLPPRFSALQWHENARTFLRALLAV